ncbi:MAG TPA: cyclase family protein, partial [Pyrinomonadaceae bacterium]|nr:cyclase family protein [Pyrinomonadaceae bacterium]
VLRTLNAAHNGLVALTCSAVIENVYQPGGQPMKGLGILLLCALAFTAGFAQQRSRNFPGGTIVDLSYAFDSTTVYWPTAEPFQLEKDFEGVTDQGFYYSAYRYKAAEHGGTHLDAPVHFARGHHSADQIPLEQLLGVAVVIDVTRQCAGNPDYRITTQDFLNWERRNGMIGAGTIVLLRTGFGKYYPDRKRYLGTAERGQAAVPKLHFPGLHPDAARWLVTNRSIKAIGLDTASIDYGQSTKFESHQILFDKNIPAFENVANLDKLPLRGFSIIALPMKIKGGSGGPLRIIAILRS